jgi:hypothetical protein
MKAMTEVTDRQFKEWQEAIREGRAKLTKYPGTLGEPIFYNPILAGEQADSGNVQAPVTVQQRKYREETRAIESAKWRALFWLYGIEQGTPSERWEELARALVAQHIPGFQYTNTLPPPRKRRGRPRKRNATTDLELLRAVEEARGDLAKKRKCPLEFVSVKDAIKGAIKRNPGKLES